MVQRIRAWASTLAGALAVSCATLAFGAAAASASETVLYNNLPPLAAPGKGRSQAFEATQMSQFGGQVELVGATKGHATVTVGMSSWACQSGTWSNGKCSTGAGAKFEWPVTLHIYSVGTGNAVGSSLVTLTKTFKMPYRPSASSKCTGLSAGAWYHRGECDRGKFFRIRFILVGVTLPSKVVISVSYNTSDYGAEPQRPKPCDEAEAGCPYDSLNVGLTEPTKFNVQGEPEPVPPTVGADPAPEDAYHDSLTAGNYCDKGLQGTGAFRLDSGAPPCWSGFQPLLRVATR